MPFWKKKSASKTDLGIPAPVPQESSVGPGTHGPSVASQPPNVSSSKQQDHGTILQDDNRAGSYQPNEPNRLAVTTKGYDSSVVLLSTPKMKELQLSRGDTVVVKGKRRRDTVLIVLQDQSIQDNQVGIDEVVKKNLRVSDDDFVFIHPCTDIKYAKRVAILPYADTVVGFSGSLFEQFLAPYFKDAYRPVRQGDHMIARSGDRHVEFLIQAVDPPEHGLVGQDTIIHCEGEPLQREDPLKAQLNDAGYEDVGGYREQGGRLRELVEVPLFHPFLFREMGVEPTRGILLHGAPGTGKTLMVRALANETGAYLFLIQGSELMSSEHPTKQLQQAFDNVEKNAPSILFIEDIDLMAPVRNTADEKGRRILSMLLGALGGNKPLSGVIMIATSNDANQVDPALRRSGRLGCEIHLGNPDVKERKQILRIHTRSMKLSKDFDLSQIAARTDGFVGADIASLCFFASMQQISKKTTRTELGGALNKDALRSVVITMKDFDAAIRTIAAQKSQR